MSTHIGIIYNGVDTELVLSDTLKVNLFIREILLKAK